MTEENKYGELIEGFDWDDLQELWQEIELGETPQWPPGKAFEYLVLRAFQLDGAEVRWPFEVSIDGHVIEQIDGVIYMDGLACLIESKDVSEKVNFEPIAKLHNQVLRRPPGTLGMIFSRNGFTDPAVRLVQVISPKTILLWGGDEVAHALKVGSVRCGLVSKFRWCVERGIVNYHTRTEEVVR